MRFVKQKLVLPVFIVALFSLSFNFVLAKTEGLEETFFVEKNYDISQRAQVSAKLVRVSSNAYFYIESDWYLNITDQTRGIINQNLANLANSFDQEIYPKLTSLWGFEWKPGIDHDEKITILFHQMPKGVAGYFNDANEYQRQQSPFSNEREMVYLSAEYLKSGLIKSYLAHEFTHLITFNQKERLKNVNEDVWLTEAWAEYSVFYLGYDNQGQNANLQQRINDFSKKPSDSLVIWSGEETDYGIVVMFIKYLTEKYGQDILVASLRSKKIGVDSLDEALILAGENKSFLQIFNDWAVAVVTNDCSLGEIFCYKNSGLSNLRIPANLIVLPSTGKTNLSLNYSLMPWSSNWYRFIGSEGDLKLTFNFDQKAQFLLKYILCEVKDGCKVFEIDTGGSQKKDLIINNFNQTYSSLTLAISAKPKFSNIAGLGDAYSFAVLAQTTNEPSYHQEEEIIKALLLQIEKLKSQIALMQDQLLAMGKITNVCSVISDNLFMGVSSLQVKCLQEFLKNQGLNIYPQGIVSGYFGNLTKMAVIKFQEKHNIPATGFVGVLTKAKINQMLLK